MSKFELPKTFEGLDDAAITTHLDAALAESAELSKLAADEMDDAQLERAEYLVDSIDAIRAEQGTRSTAAAERLQRVEAAKTRLDAAATTPDEPAGDEDPADPADPAVDAAVDEVVIPDDASSITEGAAVVASAKKGVASQVAAKAPAVKGKVAAPTQVAKAFANADVSGFATGAELNGIDDLTQAMIARFGGMPKGKGKGKVSNRFGVAKIKRASNPAFEITRGDQYGNMARIINAAKEFSLDSDNALVAAGGWCAPSETAYKLTTLGGVSNLLQLPEVSIVHGGLSFTRGIDPAAIYTDSGFLQTETEAEAGTEKNFIDVECPEFQEVRLDAIGFGIRAGILTEAGWPELVAEYIREVQKAHAYKVNAYKVGKIVTAAGAAINATELGSILVDTLSQLELQALRLRYKYRLPESEVIEGFAPLWAKGVFRQDIAFQEGKDVKAITDAEIEGWLAVRKIRLQWIFGYQDLAATGTTYPATLDIILYPKGTYVVGTTDVISLDAVYDTASLAVNTYTAAFFEEGVMLFSPSGNGVKVQLTLASSGAVGRHGAADITNLTAQLPIPA